MFKNSIKVGFWQALVVGALAVLTCGTRADAAAPDFASISNGADFTLSSFPTLSQQDAKNYDPAKGLISAKDTIEGTNDKVEVKDLACAATVYVMIERGRQDGKSGSLVDDFYPDPRKSTSGTTDGAIAPNYVERLEPIDLGSIVDSLKAKRPVVLEGVGGPLKTHYVLVVGVRRSDNQWELVANDPWTGKQIYLTTTSPIVSSTYKDLIFVYQKRLTTAVQAKTAGDEAPAQTKSITVATQTATASPNKLTVTLKDGMTLTGTLDVKQIVFKTRVGSVEVPVASIVSFTDGELKLKDNILKGEFTDSDIPLVTSLGRLKMPSSDIVRIETVVPIDNHITPQVALKIEPPDVKPTTTPSVQLAHDGRGVLTGSVNSMFQKPIPGVTVSIADSALSTKSDADGNFAIEYVPGEFTLTYQAPGYYPNFRSLHLTTAANYPQALVTMVKELPAKAEVCVVGATDYIPLQGQNIEVKKVGYKGDVRNLGLNSEANFSIAGKPVVLQSDGEVVFVGHLKDSMDIYKVGNDGSFYKRLKYNTGQIPLGDIGLRLVDTSSVVKSQTINFNDNCIIRTVTLEPGRYVLAAGKGAAATRTDLNGIAESPIVGLGYFVEVVSEKQVVSPSVEPSPNKPAGVSVEQKLAESKTAEQKQVVSPSIEPSANKPVGPRVEQKLAGNETAEQLKWEAFAGNAMAQNALGEMYQSGQGGLERDDIQAVRWYREAAEQGLAAAQRNLGICYWKGLKIEVDQKLAVEWLHKAAQQGDTQAQDFLKSIGEK